MMKKSDKEITPTQTILRFLESFNDGDSPETFSSIVAFLQQDEVKDIIESISDRITCKYSDYLNYFDSTENIEKLIGLKEENPEKYYTVVHYSNLMLNLLCNILNMNQTIVLSPENLYKSYFLVIKVK